MQKLASFLVSIGIFLLFACPVYQGIDAWIIKNEPGGGIIVSGDNPVFREVIGIKTTYHFFLPSSGWEETGDWKIQTPNWMQYLGLPKIVTYGNDGNGQPSTNKMSTQITVWILRWIIKLIPVILIIIGLILVKPDKDQINLKTQAL